MQSWTQLPTRRCTLSMLQWTMAALTFICVWTTGKLSWQVNGLLGPGPLGLGLGSWQSAVVCKSCCSDGREVEVVISGLGRRHQNARRPSTPREQSPSEMNHLTRLIDWHLVWTSLTECHWHVQPTQSHRPLSAPAKMAASFLLLLISENRNNWC